MYCAIKPSSISFLVCYNSSTYFGVGTTNGVVHGVTFAGKSILVCPQPLIVEITSIQLEGQQDWLGSDILRYTALVHTLGHHRNMDAHCVDSLLS